jgi:hypothetical protein
MGNKTNGEPVDWVIVVVAQAPNETLQAFLQLQCIAGRADDSPPEIGFRQG